MMKLESDMLSEYFELYSIPKAQLSAIEMMALSEILKYLNDIKMKVTSQLGLPLKSCQIIVVPPQFADWDIGLLRALFLETGWITTKDGDSKLVLVPYIEAYLDVLQTSDTHKEHFQREGKYILLAAQQVEEDKVIYTTTCFQMQCAKELVAISKKLAFSDFLLVPSIFGSRSIC